MDQTTINGILAIIGALTTLVGAVVAAVQTIRGGRARREADALSDEMQAGVKDALERPSHAPIEAENTAKVVTSAARARAKEKATKALPKAPLGLLLALIGLSGCGLPERVELSGHAHLVAREKAERALHPHCRGCLELDYQLGLIWAPQVVGNMVTPPVYALRDSVAEIRSDLGLAADPRLADRAPAGGSK